MFLYLASAIIFRFPASFAFCHKFSAAGALPPMKRVKMLGFQAASRAFPSLDLSAAF